MAEQQPASVAGPIPPPSEQRIHLRILSPGTAIPETVDIRDVPLSTTIEALKQRIFLVSPSHPPPPAQRLIFAGRLLANDQASLTLALGAEAIRNNDLLTLHMIVRDHSSDGTTRPITRSGTPSGTRMSRESSSRGQDGRAAGQVPGGQPQLFPPPGFPLANGLGPIPQWPPGADMEAQPELQQARQIHQQQHPGLASHFQQHAAMHQAAMRQAAMLQQQQLLRQEQLQQQQQQQQGQQGEQPQQPQGQQEQQQSQGQPQQQQQQQPRVVVGGTYHWNFGPRPPMLPGQDPRNQAPSSTATPGDAQQPGVMPGNFAPQHQVPPMGVPMHMPIPNMHPGIPRIPLVPHTPMLASTALAQSLANIRAREQLLLAPADMYLVSSPRGPQAVVYHESGTYQAHLPGLATTLPYPTPTTQTQNTQQAAAQPGRNPAANPAQAGQQAGQAAPVAANAQQQAGALQAVNAAAPAAAAPAAGPNALINHFWLLFRILVFAYFLLGHDQGWRRPLILLMVAVGFIMLRAMDANGALRNAARGWWNGIVGVPERRAAAGQAQGGQQPAGAAQPTQAQPGQQGQAQHNDNMSPLRRRLRPIEQAAALFIASLWPGVGENTIRQRREAEAQQRREQAEAATAAADAARAAQDSVTAAEPQEAPRPGNENGAQQDERDKTGGVGVSGDAQNSRGGHAESSVKERKPFSSEAEGSGQPSVS